jgi:hypothetical protein
MKGTTIIAILLLIAIAYYYFVVIKKPEEAKKPEDTKTLKVEGYADDQLTLLLNNSTVATANDWKKKFIYLGKAKTGDTLKFIVHNTGGPGGFICTINWNGQMIYSNPSTFQSTTPAGVCDESNVRAWWSGAENLSSMGNAKWIWGNNCVDLSASSTNPAINTFTYVLP